MVIGTMLVTNPRRRLGVAWANSSRIIARLDLIGEEKVEQR